MTQNIVNNYTDAIKAIKQAILNSRYKAAVSANREMLMLYFGIGEYISQNSRNGQWGMNAIEVISQQLQKELPGIRGFSSTNLKNMRLFYEAWALELPAFKIRQLPTDEFSEKDKKTLINKDILIRQIPSDELDNDNKLSHFVSIGFTQHVLIINRIKSLEERFFYIKQCSIECWSIDKLKYNINSNLYAQKGNIVNNFVETIAESDLRGKALRSFKNEYLLDFINIEDPDEEDERTIENKIVLNIKKFIMALGMDFAFIGNQYRLLIDEKEFFIDLLFFNRRLQCLVAIELKKKEFKPEHIGKMNFYLSALDEYIKQPHENPSIGIILCKEKSNKIVEFSFRDTNKPMGVATYKTATELPPEYQDILPSADKLKALLDEQE
ncbi:MAG: PDDEXK nuclease domain-containing protein [Elusimicrobiota bacterium]|jgi:predicted nuclease of restriction endonuclease-like (RecB) superfamily|nr:PDDEXK nuclease domain-containing protein [Elusimicrobiota bacterium]